MIEKDIEVFVDLISNFFQKTAGVAPEVGVPFIKSVDTESVLLDYTGIIGISGERKGCVFFTTTRFVLSELAGSILDVPEPDDESIRDLAGEIANTISGNAREFFGSDFMISLPVVIDGRPRGITWPMEVPTYIVPLEWKGHKSYLVIGLK